MSDRDDAGLRGPVRTVSSEYASFDSQTNDWGPFRSGPTQSYDIDGRLEGRPAWDDGITTIDDRGVRTTVNRWGPRIRRQPGMEWGMGFDPARLVDVLTRYDAADRPVEIVYRNAEQQPLHRIELTYDGNGRLFRERVIVGDDFGWSPSVPSIAAGQVAVSPQEQQQLTAMLKRMLLDSVFMTREYEYNERGRVSELRSTQMGLAETLQTYTYDDHDNVIEEHEQEASREGGVNRAGRLVTLNETTSESWTRYEYRYDDYGNWVERIVLRRDPPDPGFRRTATERRTFTYF
jgi:YD repeat-containing protein